MKENKGIMIIVIIFAIIIAYNPVMEYFNANEPQPKQEKEVEEKDYSLEELKIEDILATKVNVLTRIIDVNYTEVKPFKMFGQEANFWENIKQLEVKVQCSPKYEWMDIKITEGEDGNLNVKVVLPQATLTEEDVKILPETVKKVIDEEPMFNGRDIWDAFPIIECIEKKAIDIATTGSDSVLIESDKQAKIVFEQEIKKILGEDTKVTVEFFEDSTETNETNE